MKIYIAGKITGDPNYKEKFAAVQREIESDGNIVLNPAIFPEGLEPIDYMRMSFAMIDAADMVVYLPGYLDSAGARLEADYCNYVGKLAVLLGSGD